MISRYEKKVVRVFLSEEKRDSEFARLFKEGLSGKESGHYSLMLFDEFQKVFSAERLKLLTVIARNEPSSIRELARMVERDVKNVYNDLKLLYSHGLVEFEERKGRKVPVVPYRKLKIEFADEIRLETSEKKIA